MTDEIILKANFPVHARTIYDAWLDPAKHAAFTGSPAKCEPIVGGAFTAWDGYISGKNLILEPGKKIVQSWRTTDFPASAPDSLLEITLEETDGVTSLTLKHTEIPEGQGDDYQEGWEDYYLAPMKDYFKA